MVELTVVRVLRSHKPNLETTQDTDNSKHRLEATEEQPKSF